MRVLGGVEVRQDDGGWAPVSGAGLQALVALLALRAPRTVSADNLIDELWGDEQPSNPENALQARISQLRRLLGRDAVVRRDAGYVLVVEPDDVDAIRFERLVREGREAVATDLAAAGDRFTEALELVHGLPLGGLLDHRFAVTEASRIEELVLAAHEGQVDALLAAGRHADVVPTLTTLVADHPLRERFHAQLVLALYRSGRQAEALAACQAARHVLRDELGLDPGEELQALEHGVLTHDVALTGGVSALPDLPQATVLPGDRDLEAWRSGDAMTGASGRFPLAGRLRELAEIEQVLDDAGAGQGRMLLLQGEPGIGKTRLAEELSSQASARGTTVVWGGCYEGRGAPAFWPWTQVVEALVDRLDPDAVREALGSDASELAQIAPG